MPINIMVLYLNCLLFICYLMLFTSDIFRYKHLFTLQRNDRFVHKGFTIENI